MTGYNRFYQFEPNMYEGRYFCANRYSCAIVMMVKPGVDWAAYIGGYDGIKASEDETLLFVARSGSKLREGDARYFFPDIDLPYRD